MRGKGILLALVLFILSVGFLHLMLCPASLDQYAIESDEIDETVVDPAAHSAFLSQFYENDGQVAAEGAMFYGRMPGGMIGFGETMIHLWMEGTDSCVFLSFVGANIVTPMGLNEVSQHNNYFLGGRGTYTGIRGYNQIVYEDLWPGIDLCYHATADGVKYEFRVAAGTNPDDIRIRCEGHDSLVIGESTVCISKDNGTFVDEGLRAFQGLTDIDVMFSSYGPHTFGFEVGDYNESKDLIIDPLVYSTFIGGSNSHCTTSVAVDSSGNAFVTGTTFSPDFPTVNAYDGTYRGNGDCFVFKLSFDGSTLLYSTFIGGNEDDGASSITLDSSGNAFVAGVTGSPDFPMVNAYNSTFSGYKDCFVFKLSADGSTLLYSTFIGGNEYDWASSIAVDSSGNAYVTGTTDSPDFPMVNAYNSTDGGDRDCFVLKLSADGLNLLYSTFIGGTGFDGGSSIAVDSFGIAYITGYTESPDFPTVNAYNSTHGGGYDCFVFKFSADGSTLLYSTFIGGTGFDGGSSIALDSSGNAYVTGTTDSPDFPTVNAYNSTYGGGLWGGDCFVFKLSADGLTLLYSTFVGGTNDDWSNSIAVDSSGNAFVAGVTGSPDFPMVNAYNSTYGGGGAGGCFLCGQIGDCFVFRLSADGSTLIYSTFLGGTGYDEAGSIAVDSSGNAYVAGVTGSPDFPRVNAYNSTHGGHGDCFVLKIDTTQKASQQDYVPFIDYTFLTSFFELLLYFRQVALWTVQLVPMFMMGVLIRVALGIPLLVPIFVTGILIYRSATETTEVPPADYRRYKRLVCPHCNASYLYNPQPVIDSEGPRCQNCDREFLIGTKIPLDKTVPLSIVRVPIGYVLLSRLRESWRNKLRKEESE